MGPGLYGDIDNLTQFEIEVREGVLFSAYAVAYPNDESVYSRPIEFEANKRDSNLFQTSATSRSPRGSPFPEHPLRNRPAAP